MVMKCHIDMVDIADKLYTFGAPISPPFNDKQLWPKDIAGRGSKKRPIYRVKAGRRIRAEALLCKDVQARWKEIIRCCSSLIQFIGK